MAMAMATATATSRATAGSGCRDRTTVATMMPNGDETTRMATAKATTKQ